MFIDITLIGEVEQGKGLRRSGQARRCHPGYRISRPGGCGLQLLLDASDDLKILEHPLVKIYNTPSTGLNWRGDCKSWLRYSHD